MQPNYPPQYPQAPQGYPQGYPQQPQYAPPAAPQTYAQPQYAPQQPQGYPAYPQPQYAQPQYAPPAPPQAPLPTGSLDTYYSQPSGGGGPSFKFRDANAQPQIGKSYVGIVERPITDADVRAQTDNNGRVQTFKDGRPKFVLVVPMLVQPSTEFPDGRAGWWVKGQARDELARAMAEAGAPAGAPEAGAGISVTLVSVRPVPNMSPAYQYRVNYVRPQGAGQAPQQAVVAMAPGGHPVPGDAVPPQGYVQAPPAQPGYVPTPYGQAPAGAVHPEYAAAVQQPGAQVYVPQQPVSSAPVMSTATGQPVVHQQQVPPAPAPQAAPQPPPQQTAPAPSTIPADFNADQAALFAKLTGAQQPAAH